MTEEPTKVALVTGATRGIGWEIAKILSPDFLVLVGGRDRARTEAAARSLQNAYPFVADVSDPQQIDEAITEAVAPLGRIDVLVNSAGVAYWAPLERTSREQWERMMAVNVLGLVDLTVKLIPYIEVAHGMVVNINSGSGYSVSPGYGAYSASKFALRAFTDGLRMENAGRFRVTSIHPGRVSTDMQRQLEFEAGPNFKSAPELDPESVAKSVRLAVDMPPDASIDNLSIRPTL